MRDTRETIEYRVECDGCNKTTPFFSDRDYPTKDSPNMDAEDMAYLWAKTHGWIRTSYYGGGHGNLMDYCPECLASTKVISGTLEWSKNTLEDSMENK